MRRTRTDDYQEIVSTVGTILGIAAVIFLALILVRIQRGLLGIVLAALAAGLFVYWLTEMRKTMKRGLRPALPRKDWGYEVTDEGEEVRVVADVPGPSENVKIKLVQDVLEIEGGKNFRRSISIKSKVEINSFSYLNGVLHVKMKKIVL